MIDLLALLPLPKSPYYRGNLTRRQYSVGIERTSDFTSVPYCAILRTTEKSELASTTVVESIVEQSFVED